MWVAAPNENRGMNYRELPSMKKVLGRIKSKEKCVEKN